jgi:hypothetical protein
VANLPCFFTGAEGECETSDSCYISLSLKIRSKELGIGHRCTPMDTDRTYLNNSFPLSVYTCVHLEATEQGCIT